MAFGPISTNSATTTRSLATALLRVGKEKDPVNAALALPRMPGVEFMTIEKRIAAEALKGDSLMDERRECDSFGDVLEYPLVSYKKRRTTAIPRQRSGRLQSDSNSLRRQASRVDERMDKEAESQTSNWKEKTRRPGCPWARTERSRRPAGRAWRSFTRKRHRRAMADARTFCIANIVEFPKPTSRKDSTTLSWNPSCVSSEGSDFKGAYTEENGRRKKYPMQRPAYTTCRADRVLLMPMAAVQISPRTAGHTLLVSAPPNFIGAEYVPNSPKISGVVANSGPQNAGLRQHLIALLNLNDFAASGITWPLFLVMDAPVKAAVSKSAKGLFAEKSSTMLSAFKWQRRALEVREFESVRPLLLLVAMAVPAVAEQSCWLRLCRAQSHFPLGRDCKFFFRNAHTTKALVAHSDSAHVHPTIPSTSALQKLVAFYLRKVLQVLFFWKTELPSHATSTCPNMRPAKTTFLASYKRYLLNTDPKKWPNSPLVLDAVEKFWRSLGRRGPAIAHSIAVLHHSADPHWTVKLYGTNNVCRATAHYYLDGHRSRPVTWGWKPNPLLDTHVINPYDWQHLARRGWKLHETGFSAFPAAHWEGSADDVRGMREMHP
ncbi:hypothetical protein CYLTODRAFT_412736 [Cylindrobasidium torrendii FP15055 ss-10]|uniref:Uncharacterized protein n=1 Tax=Cylindrobasidium torrendii FP15055 ss-10 TaxID=1314674 RepID=A0A0D7B6U2_9AGAR|nr:hypothetical protein CYLTODRAFT_412736 [Cylindrobasidium torrendii FP15055 ss-10]